MLRKLPTGALVTSSAYNTLVDTVNSLLSMRGAGGIRVSWGPNPIIIGGASSGPNPLSPLKVLGSTFGTQSTDTWSTSNDAPSGAQVELPTDVYISGGTLYARTRTAKVDDSGRVWSIGAESAPISIGTVGGQNLTKYDLTVVSDVSYDSVTGVLSKKTRTLSVYAGVTEGPGTESQSAVLTFEDCSGA